MSVTFAACDLCGGQAFKPVFPGTIRDYQRDPQRYYASSRQEAGYLPILRCQKCGMVMTNPRDDAQTLALVYGSLQDPVYDTERKNRELVARERVQLIRRVIRPAGARLLDAGCATGIFAGASRAAGWDVTGIEPSAWSIQQARASFPDINFIESSIEAASFPRERFDMITLWDVLEHVSSPTRTIQTLTPWLVQQGWLLLNLPNIDSLPAKIMGKHWVLLLREHLWYFSPRTIRCLLGSFGYEIVDLRMNLVTFSIGNILRRISQYMPEKLNLPSDGSHRILHLLNDVSFRFPIGEMIVIARKTG